MLRAASLLAIPALLLAAAWLAAPHLAELPPALQPLLEEAPYGLLAVAALLAWRFNCSRAFFAVLLLAGVYWAWHSPELVPGTPRFHRFWLALCVLGPIGIAAVGWLRERGILTEAALSRYLLLGALGLLGAWFVQRADPALVTQLGHPLLRLPLRLQLPQAGLLASVLGAALLLWRLVQLRSAIDTALIGVLAALFFACNARLDRPELISAFAAASLMLLWGVLARSHDMAYRDALTGLPARRTLDERLAALGRRYAIAMVDVDHFKRFNDRYGHEVGDQVLKMVAAQMRGVGGGGRAYRYGGEEFAVVFSRRSLEEIREPLENLRREVAGYRMRLRGHDRAARRTARRGQQRRAQAREVSVTVSIGMAERGGELRSPEQVLKAADQALYRAKRGGRNRVSE